MIVCGKKRIVHRDIKPENIFVDAEGNYKLGDFGVAKQLEKTYASMSTKGTYNYMAPEVVASKKYDSRADIYSLGIVMYKLLNNNRLPFLDSDKQLIRFSERQEAFERRIKGEKIPPIPGIGDDLNEIILKACEFKPENRYKTIEEFKHDLLEEPSKNRISRMLKKHKGLFLSSALILIVLVVSICCIIPRIRNTTQPINEATGLSDGFRNIEALQVPDFSASIPTADLTGESTAAEDTNDESSTTIETTLSDGASQMSNPVTEHIWDGAKDSVLYRPPQEYFCNQYIAYVYCTDTSIQDYVKMRNGPSSTAFGIAYSEIPNFEKIIIESIDLDGWTFCIYDGTEGWIKTRFIFNESDIKQFK